MKTHRGLRSLTGGLAGLILAALAGLLACPSAWGDVHTWKGGIGLWSDDAQWTNGAPAAGGEVILARGTVTLDQASADLASFEMKGGSLVFTGLAACVRAVDVSITNGTVTHVVNSATTTNLDGTWPVDGRVYFSCSNFTVKAPGKIDADARGYQGRAGNTGYAYGPGGGQQGPSSKGGGGGGHGSAGVRAEGGGVGGPMNGIATNPGPGSAGGGSALAGGHGGGLVRIEASNGTATVSGTITANGGNAAATGTGRGGGGSGGGIYIGCRVLAGANGVIQANAGELNSNGGPGGSGRIAIEFDPEAQAAAPKPQVRISAKRSTVPNTTSGAYSDIGTFSFTDPSLFDENWMPHTGVLICPAFTNWTVNALFITNGWMRFPNTAGAYPLIVSNGLTISGSSGILQLYKPDLRCGSLTLTNSGSLYLYSMPTSGITADRDYGALVTVSGDMIMGTNCWIYPNANSTNGASPLFRVANLEVAANGGFNANNLGYQRGTYAGGAYYNAYGPGRGPGNIYGGAGGGYGGRGGTVYLGGRGAAYGEALQPLQPGSGGGCQTDNTGNGGIGGGLVRIEVAGRLTLNGTLTANGQIGGSYGGGGSGGGIFVKCNTFSGAATGRLYADGGDLGMTSDGGGGGGRIAVWYGHWTSGEITAGRLVDHGTNAPASFSGLYSVLPGTGYANDAESGTMCYVEVLRQGTSGCLIVIR